jgi:hypothetical protein
VCRLPSGGGCGACQDSTCRGWSHHAQRMSPVL